MKTIALLFAIAAAVVMVVLSSPAFACYTESIYVDGRLITCIRCPYHTNCF